MTLVLFLLPLALYVLNSLGLYTIAKRRGLGSPWLAWLPFGNAWMLGCISDQYRYSVKKKKSCSRHVLLWLEVATAIATLIASAVSVTMFVDMFVELGLDAYADINSMDLVTLLTAFGELGGKISAVMSVVYIISLVNSVFVYISTFNLYKAHNPDNAVLLLVLSIIFGFMRSVFVFFCREEDRGMLEQEETVDPWQYPPQQ